MVELVAGIAAGQWGMFTTAQAAGVGVSRLAVARLVDAGLVRRVRQGVYVMPGVPSDAFEEVRAEWLATDPARTAGERRVDVHPVVVSDETAAAIHRIGDLSAGGVHLTASRRLQTRQAWVSVHQRTLTAKEYQWIDGLPVTTPRRTLEDLVASGRWELGQLRDLALDAINRGLIPRSEVARSPVLVRAVPELAPPVSHASLRQRLANDARERGAEPRAAYNTFFRMLFLAGLADRDGWVLKGGTNLLCRLSDPRSTLDLDLFRQGDHSPPRPPASCASRWTGTSWAGTPFVLGSPRSGMARTSRWPG